MGTTILAIEWYQCRIVMIKNKLPCIILMNKNILISVLVGYIILDLCFACVLKRTRPFLFKYMIDTIKKEPKNIAIAFIIAFAMSLGTFYILEN